MNETATRRSWSRRHPWLGLLVAIVLAAAGIAVYSVVQGPGQHATNYVITHGGQQP